MRQTVTGRFKTWNDAVHAHDALVLKGFAASDIELPAHSPGVLAGIERLVTSFFARDPLARGTHDAEPASMEPGDMVLIDVHVSDEDHATLARATLREEHAVDVAMRGAGWTWATHDAPGVREHSALEELGLAGLADAVRRRVADVSVQMHTTQAEKAASSGTGPESPGDDAGAAAPTSASAVTSHHVDVPGAPEATRPARNAAPQIPDEFLEYEDDTPAHHRTLH
jgi:hypothetical protein